MNEPSSHTDLAKETAAVIESVMGPAARDWRNWTKIEQIISDALQRKGCAGSRHKLCPQPDWVRCLFPDCDSIGCFIGVPLSHPCQQVPAVSEWSQCPECGYATIPKCPVCRIPLSQQVPVSAAESEDEIIHRTRSLIRDDLAKNVPVTGSEWRTGFHEGNYVIWYSPTEFWWIPRDMNTTDQIVSAHNATLRPQVQIVEAWRDLDPLKEAPQAGDRAIQYYEDASPGLWQRRIPAPERL